MNQSFGETGNNKNVVESVYHKVIYISREILLNLRKNMGLFLVCLLLPCIFFIAKNASKSAVYSGSFTVMHDDLTRKIYGDRIAKINMLLKNRQYSQVSSLLGLKMEQTKKIRDIQGKNILGQDLTEDMNTDKIPFTITIIASDSIGLSDVQDHLIEFLETGTQFLATRQVVKVKEIEEELQFINRQLELIDSLETKLNLTTSLGNELKQDGKGTNSIFESSYELYKKKQELERRRSFPGSLHVVDDIIVPVKAEGHWFVDLIKSILIGVVLYSIIVLFIIPVFRLRDAKNL